MPRFPAVPGPVEITGKLSNDLGKTVPRFGAERKSIAPSCYLPHFFDLFSVLGRFPRGGGGAVRFVFPRGGGGVVLCWGSEEWKGPPHLSQREAVPPGRTRSFAKEIPRFSRLCKTSCFLPLHCNVQILGEPVPNCTRMFHNKRICVLDEPRTNPAHARSMNRSTHVVRGLKLKRAPVWWNVWYSPC